MVEKRILLIAKRIPGTGDFIRFSRQEPFGYWLSGGSREEQGQSRLLLGQQEVGLLVYPGEQVELSEEVK